MAAFRELGRVPAARSRLSALSAAKRDLARGGELEVAVPRHADDGVGLAFGGVEIIRREQREPFITADGSSIRELAGPPSGNARRQSLAEAVVPAGSATVAHLHRTTEEIYLFTAGSGRMRLGDDERAVHAGDCVVIPPGTSHKLWADESAALVLLCCCAPAYSHEDTVLLEP